MKNFTFALLLSLAGAASAQTSACADIQQAWASKYHTDFGVQWPLATFACGDAVGRFAEAIHALATTSFVPNESGFRPDFYGIVAAATRRTIYQATHPHYSYAAASASAGSLWLHDAYFQGTLEWRTATLVHETRHNQAGDPLHVICDRGDARGNMSCDATFHGGEMLGSGYNYESAISS